MSQTSYHFRRTSIREAELWPYLPPPPHTVWLHQWTFSTLMKKLRKEEEAGWEPRTCFLPNLDVSSGSDVPALEWKGEIAFPFLLFSPQTGAQGTRSRRARDPGAQSQFFPLALGTPSTSTAFHSGKIFQDPDSGPTFQNLRITSHQKVGEIEYRQEKGT